MKRLLRSGLAAARHFLTRSGHTTGAPAPSVPPKFPSSASLVRANFSDLIPTMASVDPPVNVIDVETEIGLLSLHADDQVITPWIRHYHWWEQELVSFFRETLRPGMHALDVGGNIGYHTIVCAHAVAPGGRVVALEPEPANYALLRVNLARADVSAVECVRAAASASTGATRLSLSPANTGDHRTLYAASWERTIEVPCVRLDDLLRADARVDLIKIDIQGSEHLALAGAEKLVARSHPLVVVEFWPTGIRDLGEDPMAVLRYYRSLGYAHTLFELPDLDPATSDEALVDLVDGLEPGYGTLILRPVTLPLASSDA